MTVPLQLPPMVSDDSAWCGPDMAARENWIHVFTQAEINEVESAVAAALGTGKPMVEIGAGDFPLPNLCDRLGNVRKDILRGRGFQLFRGLPLADRPIEWAAMAFWGLGTHFGNARSQNAQGHMLGHVRDMGLSTDDPNVRIYQTTERQNFHTDSCDIVGLVCLKTAVRGGISAIVSSMTIYNEIRKLAPDLLRLLFEPFATDRRGEVPEGQKPYYMMPVFHWYRHLLSAVYTRPYINSAQTNHPEAPRLSADHVAALDLFDALANDPSLNLNIVFEPGDIQLLHNHTILHDRTAYEDAVDPSEKRHLLRLWLAAPDARVLPESFEPWYGSVEIGNRGGIMVPGTKLQAPLNTV
jgi:hypothetical protein